MDLWCFGVGKVAREDDFDDEKRLSKAIKQFLNRFKGGEYLSLDARRAFNIVIYWCRTASIACEEL